MTRNTKTYLIALLLLVGITSCGQKKSNEERTVEDKTSVANEELADLPPDMTFNDAPSVYDILSGNTTFDEFHKSLKSAGMHEELTRADDLTVFVPINEGFNRITEAKLAHLKTPEGKNKMKNLIQYHVVQDEYDYQTLKSTIKLNENVLRLKTLNGGYVALTTENNAIYITDEAGFQSKVIKPDLEAENGVVHGISSVLLVQ